MPHKEIIYNAIQTPASSLQRGDGDALCVCLLVWNFFLIALLPRGDDNMLLTVS